MWKQRSLLVGWLTEMASWAFRSKKEQGIKDCFALQTHSPHPLPPQPRSTLAGHLCNEPLPPRSGRHHGTRHHGEQRQRWRSTILSATSTCPTRALRAVLRLCDVVFPVLLPLPLRLLPQPGQLRGRRGQAQPPNSTYSFFRWEQPDTGVRMYANAALMFVLTLALPCTINPLLRGPPSGGTCFILCFVRTTTT
jgi:hypothetical protein